MGGEGRAEAVHALVAGWRWQHHLDTQFGTSSADVCCVCARQFTLILHASKRLPKQCMDYLTGKAKQRRTVGVRLPGDAICQVRPAPAPSCWRQRSPNWLRVFHTCGCDWRHAWRPAGCTVRTCDDLRKGVDCRHA